MTHADDSVELWLVDLAASAAALEALECDTPRLAGAERARAAAIADAAGRRQRLAAYAALRVLLERVAGPAVRRQPLARGPAGKPRLAGGGAEFSLSHTEGFALIGVAAASPVGVDVERRRPLRMLQRRRDEIRAVGSGLGGRRLFDPESHAGLMQAWVRLEAFSKARGRALAQTLADLGLRGKGGPVPPARLQAEARRLARQAGLAVSDLDLPPGLHGAAAVAVGVGLPGPRLFPADRAGLDRLLAEPWPSRGVESGPLR
jgi:4'-phosphopantetheinyl transferase